VNFVGLDDVLDVLDALLGVGLSLEMAEASRLSSSGPVFERPSWPRGEYDAGGGGGFLIKNFYLCI